MKKNRTRPGARQRSLQRDLSAPEQIFDFDVGRPDDGERLDRLLATRLRWLSRAAAQELIREGRASIAPSASSDVESPKVTVRASTRLKKGQRVFLRVDAAHIQAERDGEPQDFVPEAVEVLFEDEHLIVLHKPSMLSIHPSPRHLGGSLTLWAHQRHRLFERPGQHPPTPCHRLDRETSGVLVMAKSLEARRNLGRQFEERTVSKTYLAWVRGEPSEAFGTIDGPIGPDPACPYDDMRQMVDPPTGGRTARTDWRVGERAPAKTLLELHPATGRQHQLRVHLQSIGHPILGDKLYLGGEELFGALLDREATAEELVLLGHSRLALHAWKLSLRHPIDGVEVEYEAPPGSDFRPV